MGKKEIKIHVTENDYEKIKEKAIAKGMSIKAYSEFAVLHRRDRRKTADVAIAMYELLEKMEEFTDELGCIERQLQRLNDEPPHDALGVALMLEETAVSFRRLCREHSELLIALGGGMDGNP